MVPSPVAKAPGVLKLDDSRNQQKHGAVTPLHAFIYAQKLAVQGIATV